MKFQQNLKVFTGQWTVAPFASVAFILVLFLALNTVLVHTPGVRIELPASAKDSGPSHPSLIVSVDRSGQLFFEQQAISASRLQSKLLDRVKESKSPLSLVVQADAGTPYAVLLPLARLAEEAGFRELLWATRPPVVAPGGPGQK